MHLTLLPDTMAVCRLPLDTSIQPDLLAIPFVSLTRTAEELSLVLPSHRIRAEWRVEDGWRMFQVAGPLDFGLTGIVAALTTPLAEAGIAVFVISTFDTDYLLVKADRVQETQSVLERAGHTVSPRP